jgi:sortase (surface protein transpeptidase)
MINVTYTTPFHKLNKVKIGDELVDEYENKGKVIKINKSKSIVGREYLFLLDTRQTIYILSEAI